MITVTEVFLSDLNCDPGERNNSAEELPDICTKMKEKALERRKEIKKTRRINLRRTI